MGAGIPVFVVETRDWALTRSGGREQGANVWDVREGRDCSLNVGRLLVDWRGTIGAVMEFAVFAVGWVVLFFVVSDAELIIVLVVVGGLCWSGVILGGPL